MAAKKSRPRSESHGIQESKLMSRISGHIEKYLLLADGAASVLAFTLDAALMASPWPAAGAGEIFFLSAPFFLACMGYFAAKEHYVLKASWWLQVEHVLLASLAAFIL